MTYVEWLFFPPIQNPQEKFFPAVTRVRARQGDKKVARVAVACVRIPSSSERYFFSMHGFDCWEQQTLGNIDKNSAGKACWLEPQLNLRVP